MDIALIAELLNPFVAQQAPHNIDELFSHGPGGDAGSSGTQESTLANAQLESILTYINLLVRWNSRINLTAIRDPEQIVTRHFGESLFTARHLFPDGSAKARVAAGLRPGDPDHPTPASTPNLLDIGSGAGFPAIPIKIWTPQIHLTLVESNQKKTTFLREVSRALTLTNVNVSNARAEDLPPSTADIVTLRAVERFRTILPNAVRLARSGGRVALLIGESQIKDALAADAVQWMNPVPIPQSSSRVLLIGKRLS